MSIQHQSLCFLQLSCHQTGVDVCSDLQPQPQPQPSQQTTHRPRRLPSFASALLLAITQRVPPGRKAFAEVLLAAPFRKKKVTSLDISINKVLKHSWIPKVSGSETKPWLELIDFPTKDHNKCIVMFLQEAASPAAHQLRPARRHGQRGAHEGTADALGGACQGDTALLNARQRPKGVKGNHICVFKDIFKYVFFCWFIDVYSL